jgi:hypothetical protein
MPTKQKYIYHEGKPMIYQSLFYGKVATGRRCALRLGMAVAFLAGAFLVGLNPAPAQAAFIGLGEAANYSFFDVSNSEWQMNNSLNQNVTIYGDMAAGPGTTYNWSGSGGPYSNGSTMVYYQTGGTVPPVANLGGNPRPTTQATDLTQAVADARAAATSIALLTANLTVSGGKITNTTGTITGNGPGVVNVVDLTQVNMTNGAVLISGSANEWFIFRVSGDFIVGNSSIRVTGGLTPDHVLWDITGTGVTVKSPNGAWDGTILALNSGVSFDNTPSGLGACNGAIIAADDVNNNQNWKFSIVSGFDLNYYPFEGPDLPVPLPPSALLLGTGLLGLVGWRRFGKS